MKAPFLGQAYASRSPILSSQTAINIFPELTEQNSDEVGAFYGTPGISAKFTGSGEVRGVHVAGGYLWAVIGSTVWRLDSSYGSLNVGSLPNSSGRVSMVHNPTQLAVAHQDGWHWIALNGTSIASVSGAPQGSILTYQDQYVLFTDVRGLFGITALADLSTIDPLDVADAEGDPDNLVAVISSHREAWLLGEETTEVWDNTGAALFPFERNSGVFIDAGCAAKFSVAKGQNTVFWVGRDRTGMGMVLMANGYAPVRISTHPIEHLLNGCSNLSDAIGWCYHEEGHIFYWLTIPPAADGTGDVSFVYDTAAKGWHQRAWMDSNGLLHRHRANCYCQFGNDHVVGDWQNGKIYKMSLDTYTDDGAVIYRERAFDIPDSEQKRVRIDKFEVFANIGDGASPSDGSPIKLWLQVSRDAGRNFGYQRIITTGYIGQTKARARWRRLGNGRDIVVRVATTMSNRVQWVSANMEAEQLSV